MKNIIIIGSILGVAGIGFWLYKKSHSTNPNDPRLQMVMSELGLSASQAQEYLEKNPNYIPG